MRKRPRESPFDETLPGPHHWEPRAPVELDAEFATSLQEEVAAPQGENIYRKFVRLREEFCHDLTMVKTIRIFAGQVGRQLAPSSLVTYLDHIKRWAGDDKEWTREVWDELKKLRNGASARAARLAEETTRPLSTATLNHVLQEIKKLDPRACAGMYVMSVTGIRADQLSRLSKENFKEEGRKITVRLGSGKTIHRREELNVVTWEPWQSLECPLGRVQPLIQHLHQRAFPWEMYDADAINTLLAEAFPGAGLTSYCFRKTFAMIKDREYGGDPVKLASAMGHRDVRTAKAFYRSVEGPITLDELKRKQKAKTEKKEHQ